MITYDNIGTGYNITRHADPYIADRLYNLLYPSKDGLYLDIGCGTGNYLKTLTAKGLTLYGIDPSETMLISARAANPYTTFLNATAESIPLSDNFFNGAIAVLTIHHWQDIPNGLTGLARVLKPASKAVFFSFTPQQMRGYWLYHYFPQMIERCMAGIPTLNDMCNHLSTAGFHTIETEKYFIDPTLQDHFLYSNKFRPAQYLNPTVRDGASAFRLHCPPDELSTGLATLESDITSRSINSIMQFYENDLGDYLFISATKS